LAVAIADFERTTEGRIARWGRIFTTAAAKTADARVRGMVTAAGGFLLGLLRARLGDEFADIVESVGGQLRASQDERLAARIASESDADALAAFCLLAAEMQELIAGRLVLSIDRAERLADDDFRYLLDLFEQIPVEVHLLIAHSARSPEDTRRVRLIKESIVQHSTPSTTDTDPPPQKMAVITLAGLTSEEVATWMRRRNLDPSPAIGGLEEVMRVTAGYPLYVDLALTAIERGESLGNLSGEEAFITRTQQNYADLEYEDQRCAMLLSAFSDPPEEETLLDLLRIDRTLWALRESRLIEARILVTSVDEVPWFHELGRRAIWECALTARQRGLTAQAALAAAVRSNESRGGTTLPTCIDMAQLCGYAPDFVRQHDKLAGFLALEANELAILASLIEMTEESNKGASRIGPVISHARNRFGSSGDLVAVTRSLAERSLVVIAENEHSAVVIAAWGSEAAYMITIGRMARVLNRVPIPSIASKLFNGFLLPTIGSFHVGHFGLGNPSISTLSEELKEAEYERTDNAVHHRRRPGIVMSPRLGELDLFGSINFDSDEERDQAFDALSSIEPQLQLFGERFSLEYVKKWPHATALAARRFARAVELATGEDYTRASLSTKPKHLPPVGTADEEMELTVRMLRTVRELSSPLERLALRLERGRGVAFIDHNPGVTVAEVMGRDVAVRLDSSLVRQSGPHWFAEMEGLVDLGPGESLGTITNRMGQTAVGTLFRNSWQTRTSG
jgi:hypothetical protein